MTGLANIDAAASKMAEQLDQLVDSTRISMGEELELRRGRIDLVVLASRIAAEQRQTTQNHHIEVATSRTELLVHADAVQLARVLDNLVSNAIKYSPNGGEVTIRISQDDRDGSRDAVLAIEDHGLGIPAADRDRIFEHFRRAGNVAGRIGGTGIGLASSRKIVEQHGGSITVESVEGAGSIFTVRLPLGPMSSTS
jgi:signal transduction histidine kinase